MNVTPRTPACPTELALEEHLVTPDPVVEAHATGCARCRAWLQGAAAVEERFQAEVLPRLVPRLRQALAAAEDGAARTRTRSRARHAWWLGGLAAAACAGLAIALLPVLRPPELLAKGAGLTVYVRHGEEVRVARPGERVVPGDELRFSLAPARTCFAWVASLDAAGTVSLLAPAGGAAPARVQGPGTLPGSATLDATPGPERVYVICSPAPRAWAEIEGALRDVARRRPGAEGVRTGDRLPLPAEEQATLLLEREGR
jgi:hypothetical protein